MSKKKLFLILVFASLFIFNQLSFSQEAGKTTTYYTLPNGMQIILKENHSNPLIASMVYVNAGAKYETDYNNGATHFLEHLLFDGTKTKTREDITEEIKSKGGYINAFTQKELTAYMVRMPSEYIEAGLETQADMLFNSIFPDSEITKERKIVIEEIKKDKDNIEAQVEDFFDSQIYSGTPYARPVLGYENIIATISKEEIIDYWQTYYKPNNMIALVIGDFEKERMKSLLEKYFGNVVVKPLPKLAEIKLNPVLKSEVKYKSLDTKNTYVNLGFSAPHFSDPDYFAFDLLCEYLNSGETSPLYQALVGGKEPLAAEVSVGLETEKEFTTLRINIIANFPDKVDKILSTVSEVLQKMEKEKIDPKILNGLKVSLKTTEYYDQERLHYYGILKAGTIVTCGYEFLETYLDKIGKVTPELIKNVSLKYFSQPKYIATVVKPQAKEDEIKKEKSSSEFKKEVLPNGLTVIVKSNPDSKVLAVNILGKNRSAMEPEGKTGIADLTNRLLTQGTKKRAAPDISQELKSIGARMTLVDNPYIPYDDIYTTKQFTFIRFETIDEFAEMGIELLADLIENSNFPQEEIDKAKKEMMGVLNMEEASTYQVCRNLFYQTLFKDQPYGKKILGDMKTIASITKQDLEDFHKKFYSPNNMILTVVTSIPANEILQKIKKNFQDMSKVEFISPSIPKPEILSSVLKTEKLMPKEQVYIYLGGPIAIGITDPDAISLMVTNSILSTNLGLNLREKKGLAYSVGSSIGFDKEFGWLVCSIGTRPQNYETALNGILAEIDFLKENKVSEKELEKAKNSLWGEVLLSQLSRINQAYYMARNEFLGLGYDYQEKYVESLRKVTAEDVKNVALKYFDTKNYIQAVVKKE